MISRLFCGGPEEIRTLDPYNANVVRSQLRYRPIFFHFWKIFLFYALGKSFAIRACAVDSSRSQLRYRPVCQST